MMETCPDGARVTPPSRETILGKVKQLVAGQTSLAASEVREEHELISDLGYDSLSVVELTMELEEHFDISVSGDLSDQARSVGQITDGVMRLLAERNL